jgi:apolipoprotein N-acyltransferase
VYDRTSVSEAKVITREITMNGGRTWYSRTGNLPWVALMALVLLGSWWAPGRQWKRDRDERAAAVSSPEAESA